MSSINYIHFLLGKLAEGCISTEELDILQQWINSNEEKGSIERLCRQLNIPSDILYNIGSNENVKREAYENMLDRILNIDKTQIHDENKDVLPPAEKRKFTWLKYTIAASIVCLLSVPFFKLENRHKNESIIKKENADILPGSNKAILTLNNGKQIILDSKCTGLVADEGNTKIEKQINGQLAYSNTKSDVVLDRILYNTLSTPRGGQYKILLPDGTKVWLNAASEITYPTMFSGNDREVSVKGEVYFEVAHDATKPFIVNTANNMQVRVLGTHFDVNAYPDENNIKTTLFEGSVRVTSVTNQKMLKPGEQMQLMENGKLNIIKDVDMESVIGWKEDVFNFDDADISSVMRQLSRWYDINIVYKGEISKDLFSGIINRNNSIYQVLNMLQTTLRVHFNIQNRTIYVSS